VNDAPSFIRGADQSLGTLDGPQSVSGWATGLCPGPANESGQALSFETTGSTLATAVIQLLSGGVSER
jgi:hypothetical protein